MLELAAIVAADPPSILLWAVWLLAVGMYPVGILIGCSPCCGSRPCEACAEGELPDTVTVTFDGFTDKTPGPDLIALSFSACYGSGASARVTAPGGDPATDKGAISTVSLTNGGSGYAKLGRVAPTITASGGSGSGATLTVSTTKTADACKVDYWKVSSVSVSNGTGYADGDQVTFSVATGDTEEQAASATIHTTRNAPTLTAAAYGGTGATFTVTTASTGTTPATWGVSGVTLTAGGTGYPASGLLTFHLGTGDVEESAASAYFYCGRTTPTVSISVEYSGGSGASLTPALSSITGYDGKTYWYVSGITIANGGSGYAESDWLNATVTDGQSGYYSWFYAFVSSVDEDGAITGVTIYDGGEFFKSNGIIDSIEFYPEWQGGSYYNDSGVPTSVSVEGSGIYYREDADEEPYVAAVTVGISQTAPSTGTGASITATVGSTPGTADFGKITELTIASGGSSGYLAWEWKNTVCCGTFWNGQSVVLKRKGNDPCVFFHSMCGGWSTYNLAGSVALYYYGPNTPPEVVITTESIGSEVISSDHCDTALTADPLPDSGSYACSHLEFSASSDGGATAVVSSGGEYDSTYKNPGGYAACNTCCKGSATVPVEIAIHITDNRGTGLGGTYVRPLLGGEYMTGVRLTWANFFSGAGLAIYIDLRPDIEGCNDCNANCRVYISFAPFGIYGGFYKNIEATCVSVPVCNPYGSWTLCAYDDCDTYGTYDVEVGPA